MTRKTQEVIDAIRPELQRVVPAGSQVLLFGSRARGDEREDSDFDILVLLDREGRATTEDNMGVGYDVSELFWDRNQTVNVVINTNNEWRAKSGRSLFYHNYQALYLKLLILLIDFGFLAHFSFLKTIK